MRASIRFTPPMRRSPSAQSSGTRQTYPSGDSRPLVLTMLDFFTTLHRRVCFRSSPGRAPARGHALSFCSNAHDHGFWQQPLEVVWDLLLKADPEGPALISHAAVRHLFIPCCLLSMCLCSTLNPRKSSSKMQFSTSTVALWTILSSRAATAQVGAFFHRPWVCTFGAMVTPGMLPDGPARPDQ